MIEVGNSMQTIDYFEKCCILGWCSVQSESSSAFRKLASMSAALKMEAHRSSETWINFYRTTSSRITGNNTHQSYLCENLKSNCRLYCFQKRQRRCTSEYS
jgi:hypothetical protein